MPVDSTRRPHTLVALGRTYRDLRRHAAMRLCGSSYVRRVRDGSTVKTKSALAFTAVRRGRLGRARPVRGSGGKRGSVGSSAASAAVTAAFDRWLDEGLECCAVMVSAEGYSLEPPHG